MAPSSSHKPHPPAAQPRRTIFDPWNSSSTGHQRAENRLSGSTSWRVSRTMKLASQFKAGASGGKRLYDTVGAGSEHFGKDGRKDNGGWEKGAPGLREKGWQDVRGLLHKANDDGVVSTDAVSEKGPKRQRISPEEPASKSREEEEEVDAEPPPPGSKADKKIFDGLCVFINGSTAPMVGDHRLKQILAENGAQVSIALGRRSVTHVVLGTPNGSARVKGAGGGLAATKIQKEIQRVGGKGVKYVGVEWVLESLKVGKRLPEARFSNITLAAKGQKSVYVMFSKEKPLGSVDSANG
ncbi:MAG: hypothetical protein LQ352_005888 [Teloschistes flavicans]|nr:MAG: hypothetical protein LQ352_005888 [Teloschistes flavicans]